MERGERPWGTYTVLEENKNYKIKRIEVKPGERLSLQMHHHRSEHWIVVSGTARSPAATGKRSSTSTSPPLFRWGPPTAWRTPA